jgi:ABC-type enterobactin transport system permease subunit
VTEARRLVTALAALAAVLIALGVAALFVGSAGLSPAAVARVLAGRAQASSVEAIVTLSLRLPRAVAAVLAGVAGGVAGNALEHKATSKDALEITVRLDSGEMRAIVQEADQPFTPGQRMRLLSSGGVTRVVP